MIPKESLPLFYYIVFPLSLVLLIVIEVISKNWRNSSLFILFNGSRSSFYDLFAILADKLSFYVIFLDFFTFHKYSEFKSLLGSLHLLEGIQLPIWLNSILCLLTIDFVHYWFHRLYHYSNSLYHWHSFHHSAKNLSIFVVYRDHVLEYLFKSRFILLILWGPNHSLFYSMLFRDLFLLSNHMRWDTDWGTLGKIFVSPNFHRVHHHSSTMRYNFGAVFSFWDHIFGTKYYGPKITEFTVPESDYDNKNPLIAYLSPFWKMFKLK